MLKIIFFLTLLFTPFLGGACKSKASVGTDWSNIVGLTNDQVESFFWNLKSAIQNNEKDKVASLIYYPVEADIDGTRKMINDKNEFLKNYDLIINAHIKKIVADQKYENLGGNWRGVFIGPNAEIVYCGFTDINAVKIKIFNNNP